MGIEFCKLQRKERRQEMNAVIWLIMMFVLIAGVAIWIKTPSARKFYGIDKEHKEAEK